MANLKAIRKRITSVKNTQKITRAMKLVAAARLRRAQEQIVAARPYARALEDVIAEITTRAGANAHPLLAERPIKRVLLLVKTNQRGLVGALISQVIRKTERFIFEQAEDFEHIGLAIVGRKGREYFRRRKVNIAHEFSGVTTQTVDGRVQEVSDRVITDYLENKLDAVYLVYNEFKSAISQKVQLERLLPITPKVLAPGQTPTDYLYEPSKETVLDQVLPMYLRIELRRALLESIASEFGARMSAMDNATSNARDMIGKLTLQYNRARQAAITKELLEIIGGAEALKG